MKLIFTLFLFSIQNCTINSQVYNINLNVRDSINYNNNSNINQNPIHSTILDNEMIRPLSELNQPGRIGEGYPYISSDGLRIYFTIGGDNLKSNLYFARSITTQDTFSELRLLSPNFPSGSFSCWLTNDELEIYFVTNDKVLFYSSRKSISSNFNNPEKVILIGRSDDAFISGPSLSGDNQELYLYAGGGNILRFLKTGTLTYTIKDTLNIPPEFKAEPGQISKNGLAYYLSLKSLNGSNIYKLTRLNSSSTFSNLTLFTNSITNNLSNIQPTLSSDENILIWTRNHMDNWVYNELFMLTHCLTNSNSTTKNQVSLIEVFPNPNNGVFIFKIENINSNCELSISTSLGSIIYRKPINQTENTIYINNPIAGLYNYLLSQNGTILASGKFIIE